MLQIRERKVDPDTALNDDDEQHRQTGRLEGEQQNQNNEQRRQHADEQVVLAEGAGQVHGAGGIAYHVVVTVIILAHDVMDLVHKGESLVAFLGHVQVGDQAAVLVTLHDNSKDSAPFASISFRTAASFSIKLLPAYCVS